MMNEEARRRIISNDYANLIIEYTIRTGEIEQFRNDVINIIDDKYAVVYLAKERLTQNIDNPDYYSVLPKLYGLLDNISLEETGVTRLRATPFLSLLGQGILLGFIDTGIDYANEIFKNADNTTRIAAIWDQSIENLQASEDIFYFGTEYTREQINLALQSDSPLSIVPTTDEIGHGTTLAGLAGGNKSEENGFSGIVPAAEFVVVKLKEAKQTSKEFFRIPANVTCYSQDDIMFGLSYLIRIAKREKKPIAICLGLGTNQGGHTGLDSLSDMLSNFSIQVGTSIVIAAGNEGNSAHHFYGEIDKKVGYETVELYIAENENDFTMELWGNTPGTYSIDIISPSGEYIPRIPARLNENRNIQFIFEITNLSIDYVIVEAKSGDELILMRFIKPAPGIWRFRVYGQGITTGFHIWLPIRGFISGGTRFVSPNPYTTVTNPGNSIFAITTTAYDYRNNSIYINASRGYTRSNIVKPDVATPGVNVISPLPGNTFVEASGTSIAAAILTGITAILLEWGIVYGNVRSMNTIQIRNYLIRGVERKETLIYPNREWGYGTVNIYGTFESLRGEQ